LSEKKTVKVLCEWPIFCPCHLSKTWTKDVYYVANKTYLLWVTHFSLSQQVHTLLVAVLLR